MSDVRRYLWLDLETTGLNAKLHSIIEIAAILTTSKLEELWRMHAIVRPMRPDCWDPRCVIMHRESGLMELLSSSQAIDINDAMGRLLNRLDKESANIRLAGFGVHFDRQFLHEAPYGETIINSISYRQLDLRSVVTVFDDADILGPEDTVKPHRAMQDVEHAVAEYGRLVTRLKTFDIGAE